MLSGFDHLAEHTSGNEVKGDWIHLLHFQSFLLFMILFALKHPGGQAVSTPGFKFSSRQSSTHDYITLDCTS